LSDREFAARIDSTDGTGGQRKLGLSEEEIAKVKEEWEEKQRKKAEKEAKDGSDKDNKDAKGEESKLVKVASPSQSPPPPPVKPAHERYALHRDFFAMRRGEHRKRRQTAQAKALAPQLPRAPTDSLGDKY